MIIINDYYQKDFLRSSSSGCYVVLAQLSEQHNNKSTKAKGQRVLSAPESSFFSLWTKLATLKYNRNFTQEVTISLTYHQKIN